MGQRTCYLAGPISGQTYDGATAWRDAATEFLREHGVEALSPMRDKEWLSKVALIDGAYGTDPLTTAKGITTRDRWDCQRADVVLMNLLGAERVSIGSMIEIGWADAARRPIVLVLKRGSVHDHPMVTETAGFVVPTLQEALYVVTSLLT